MLKPLIRHALPVIAVLSVLLLSACFTSEEPLFAVGDMPFGKVVKFAEIDTRGKIKIQPDGNVSVAEFNQSGSSYIQEGGDRKKLNLVPFNPSLRLYILQVVAPSNSSTLHQIIAYSFLKLDTEKATLFYPKPDNTESITAALKASNVGFNTKRTDIIFTSQEQIIAAMRVFALHLSEGDVAHFRIATTPEEINRLESDVAAAKAALPPVASAAAPTSPAQQMLTFFAGAILFGIVESAKHPLSREDQEESARRNGQMLEDSRHAVEHSMHCSTAVQGTIDALDCW